MWMSSPLHTRPLFSFSFMTFVLPDQRETCCYAWHGTRPSHLLAMRPSLGHKAPDLCLKGRTVRSFFLPVLSIVESLPGAMSPPGSKEPNEPFLLPHRVFVSSTPQKSLPCAYARPLQYRLWKRPRAGVCGKPSGKTP